MNFFSHILHLGVAEKNEGICLVWDCPRCGVRRDYNLILSESRISFAGVPLSKREVDFIDLRCTTCRYEVRVAPSERASVESASQLTRLLKDGSMPLEAYVTAIKELPGRFIRDLQAVTENWLCLKCGESNPKTFDSCWNCRSGANPEPIGPKDFLKPPSILPRGGNAWE